jgi:ABC-type glycerol-3-phosphate transport system substrate-binding protein
MKVDGKYYALPTAVRSLALFWNKTLFKEAGSIPTAARNADRARRLREKAHEA